ncbi:phosphotransferase [Nocardioides sp. LMS-CY]|uniref:phosphotransferase n=1 Tax=Nocardioides sp. (strain LMS-CY) TaxID=2840457 RepID=UPI001C0085AD|nr:phosphotransferase [Nocardioides sp. LMS-CY]QWF20062.1 phosphotransferase [Nocardioides sp. LMS-CY]
MHAPVTGESREPSRHLGEPSDATTGSEDVVDGLRRVRRQGQIHRGKLPHRGPVGRLDDRVARALLAEAGLVGWARVRSGHNAVYRSPDDAQIAKVYGEASRCSVDVTGARRAREAGVCVPALVATPHPRVAVWQRVPGVPGPIGPAAWARLGIDARRLAAVPVAVAPVHWLVNVTERASVLEQLAAGTPTAYTGPVALPAQVGADVAWLAHELRSVAECDLALDAPLAFQHGDLSPANLVHDGRRLHVIDFETVRAAPADWDVGCLVAATRRYGTVPTRELAPFLESLDPAPDPELLALCVRTKELLNASWLAVIGADRPELVGELRLRVRSLRDGTAYRWRELGGLAAQVV